MKIRVIVVEADGVSEDGFGALLEAVAAGIRPGETSSAIAEPADTQMLELDEGGVGSAAGHPMSSQDLPEVIHERVKDVPARVSGKRISKLRVTIDGEGEYNSADAARKLGCTPSAIRLAAKHGHLCKGHAIAEVATVAKPAGRVNAPRRDRVILTCDEHPEWGPLDLRGMAERVGCHFSSILLAISAERPCKGLRFRKVETVDGAGMRAIREATGQVGSGMVMGVDPGKQDSEAKPSLPQQSEAPSAAAGPPRAREVWVVGVGACNLRQAAGKCGVDFETLRRRLNNGGGECRNATVYWADEYLKKAEQERGGMSCKHEWKNGDCEKCGKSKCEACGCACGESGSVDDECVHLCGRCVRSLRRADRLKRAFAHRKERGR